MHIARHEFALNSESLCNAVFNDFYLFYSVVLTQLNKLLDNENGYAYI